MRYEINTKRSHKEFARERERYLQKDGPSRDAELDTVFRSIVPRQQLQVLDGTVGQSHLHVTCRLETHKREKTFHFMCKNIQRRQHTRHFLFTSTDIQS